MNFAYEPPAAFEELLNVMCEGELSTAQARQLETIVENDDGACWYYLCCVHLHGTLHWDCGAEQRLSRSSNSHQSEDRQAAFPVIISDVPSVTVTDESVPHALSSAPVPGFLPTTLHATFGYFSSGWPVAYLVATVIFGIGLVIGAITHVSYPVQIASHSAPLPSPLSPLPSVVGQITGMVDCRWKKWSVVRGQRSGTGTGNIQSLIPNPQSLVSLGDRFALASGLLEITYDTGAKVILQGPVVYEAESKNGGFMSLGKLTGKVTTEAARGLTIRTPTATITDLGTEFGVDVDKEGQTTSHVFRGSVKLQPVGGRLGNEGNSIVLQENESVQTYKPQDATGPGVELRRVALDPRVFTRRITQPVKMLDLRDIVAGGDGRAQRRQRGFDPTNDMGDTVLTPEVRSSDRPFRFALLSELIDRVFLLDGRREAVQLNSAGHSFAGFPKTDGGLHGSIWATGMGTPSNDKSTSNNRGLLGFRSNVGITFDLKAIRERYSDVRPSRFRSTVFCGSPADVYTTLFQDDFQSDTVGTDPAIGTGDVGGLWTSYDNYDGTLVSVLNSLTPSTNNYLKLQRFAHGTHDGTAAISGWDAGRTTNKVKLSFSLYKPSGSSTEAVIAQNGGGFCVYVYTDGSVKYDAGGTIYDTGIDLPLDSWQDVVLDFDMIARTYSIKVGNSTHYTSAFWTNDVYSLATSISFCHTGGPSGEYYVDNVKLLSVVPGLAESQRLGFGKKGQGDVWIFIDGRLTLNRMKLRPDDGILQVDVEIGPNDRFLTLASTNIENANIFPWIVFSNPVLEMCLGKDNQ